MQKFCNGDITRTEAASALGVSERTINRRMAELRMRRTTRKERADLTRHAKAELRRMVIGMKPTEAAQMAGVTLRTIYRWQRRKNRKIQE